MKIFIYLVLVFNISYTQDCEDEYTYFPDLPPNVTVIDGSSCFYNVDVEVISELISINSLIYDSPLEVGVQTWLGNRLFSWVATFTPNGSNGIDQQLSQLPENIGNLTNISSLYLEKHNLTSLPSSFTQLINLNSLALSLNYLESLPENFGDLQNLSFLDLGYNYLSSIPETIGNLVNLNYLWLFNNQISQLPESICNLSLENSGNMIWDGTDPSNYPYFASGCNQLCDSSQIPDCVENSNNFEITLDVIYYSFLENCPQNCCPNPGDLNCDGGWNVLDIVTLANCILAQNCATLPCGCAGDLNDDGGYNVLDIVTLANCILAQNCGAD